MISCIISKKNENIYARWPKKKKKIEREKTYDSNFLVKMFKITLFYHNNYIFIHKTKMHLNCIKSITDNTILYLKKITTRTKKK